MEGTSDMETLFQCHPLQAWDTVGNGARVLAGESSQLLQVQPISAEGTAEDGAGFTL